ncbi:histidine kinase [Methanosarcina mazei]|uniref:Histidine kinase n=3 Tax=Methanosarcina mazei TaxID=2209 RepID=A0A0F8H8K1_METMZ|nr:histidine kinase dimerization/phosphoacceptor domain -containing protein [Methanosarcina mazei]KKG28753.1 histidine kinase [Methanosarcina mazei]KKG31309.1 histidine kinase [Methanosarcina mazei]KKG58450.1 histidine kinase [Methanosarcina mazei]KKG63219.1 histidine kinase [Methanosarcina mazei]KKG65509.1 histidine kinase [Methanosarcina mazei]
MFTFRSRVLNGYLGERRKMEQLAYQNPNPVLRAGADGKIIYSNNASEALLKKWDTGMGEKLPPSIENLVKKVVKGTSHEKIEVRAGKKVYLVTFYPVPGEDYANIYGFEITGQKKLEQKLRIKEKQYDALYTLGRIALKCESLQAFLDESVKLIAKTLDLEFCKILELKPDGNFLVIAGTGWKPGYVGFAFVKGGKWSQAGYTIFSKVPVIVKNFAEENRFEAPEILREHNIASGMSVIIGDVEKPFGVLGAHSAKKRKFTADETFFLNSVAFIIAEVIERRYAEEELHQYKEKLEEIVKERTIELTRANEQLSMEISRRKKVEKDLENSVYFLKTLLDAIPSPVFYRNLEGIYQGCNDKFSRKILNLPKTEIIGHSMQEFREQFSEETLRETEYNDKILLKEGKSLPNELKIKCAIDGQLRDFLVYKATYSNLAGEVIGIVGVMLDITERKKAEKALLKTEEIRKKEIHHRIKNNLQVISSLLSLQAENFSDKKVKESFHDSQNRVISMSLIHEELYRTGETGDVESFDFKAYIQKLANELFRSYVVGNKDLHLKLDMENVFLGMDTGIPLGIIINELVSNSLKHAFPGGGGGEVNIRLHRLHNGENRSCKDQDTCAVSEFLLIVSDNGTGLPENIDFRNTSSLGLQLVNILVDQIGGSIELKKGEGTEFRIKFREEVCPEKKQK